MFRYLRHKVGEPIIVHYCVAQQNYHFTLFGDRSPIFRSFLVVSAAFNPVFIKVFLIAEDVRHVNQASNVERTLSEEVVARSASIS